MIESTGPSKLTRGSKPSVGSHRGGQRKDAHANAAASVFVSLELEDDAADLPDRGVEVVDGSLYPVRHLALVNQSGESLQTQSRREETLDHGVVQVAGDPFAIAKQRQLLDAFVQTRILYGHAGGARERDGQCLIGVGERDASALLGEVKVAEHLIVNSDRNAQERAHRWMPRGKPDGVRMRAEVVQPQRRGDLNELTEDSEALGGATDPAHRIGVDSLGDELNQVDVAFVGRRAEHAHRPVLRVGLVARHLDDSLEDGGKFKIRRNREDRVEDPLHITHRRSVTPPVRVLIASAPRPGLVVYASSTH